MFDTTHPKPATPSPQRKHSNDIRYSFGWFTKVIFFLTLASIQAALCYTFIVNRWCVEAPLNPSQEKAFPVKFEKTKDSKLEWDENSNYSQLHASLLESMQERSVLQNQQQLLQAEVISPRHLLTLVRGLLDSCVKNNTNNEKIQLSLDRLAQSVQVAQSSGCLYGNTRKCWQI